MKSRGFTLIETIYATLIFALVVITIFNLYPSSFLAIKRGEGTLQADTLAQSVLEELRASAFSNLKPSTPPTFTAVTYGGTEYTPLVEIFYLPDSSLEQQKYIKGARVKVSWTLQNKTRVTIHETYIHNVRR